TDAEGVFQFNGLIGNATQYHVCVVAPYPTGTTGNYCSYQHDSTRSVTGSCDIVAVNSGVSDVRLILTSSTAVTPPPNVTNTPIPSTTTTPPTVTLTPRPST